MKSSRTASAGVDQHSGRTRVTPVFTWLQAHGGSDWVTELLRLADGIQVTNSVGKVMSLCVGKEREVEPSPARLGWMIRNAHRLAPTDGRLWREYRRRVIDNPGRDEALRTLDAGDAKGLPKELKLEGVVSIVEGLNPKLIRSKLEAYLYANRKRETVALKPDPRTPPR